MFDKKFLQNIEFWKNYDVEWLAETGSTNDDLKSLWQSDSFCHLIEIADCQTNGKGQYERKWSSDASGQCLMFSFSVDVDHYDFPISMIAGVALAVALDGLGLNKEEFWLKWPNDIWVNNEKLAGILTESTCIANGFRCVVGIGLNILPLPNKSINSTSLFQHKVVVTREVVLQEFCRAWDKIIRLDSNELAGLWNKYAGQFWKKQVKVTIPNEPAFIAVPISVEQDGTLNVMDRLNQVRKVIAATILPL